MSKSICLLTILKVLIKEMMMLKVLLRRGRLTLQTPAGKLNTACFSKKKKCDAT